MGLFAPPAPGSLLKTGTPKAADPTKKKEPKAVKSDSIEKTTKKSGRQDAETDGATETE